MSGTVLAGLTWLVIRLLRGRVSPAVIVALWSIVLIKFLVPSGPGWSFSLTSAWEQLAVSVAGETRVATEAAEADLMSVASQEPVGADKKGTLSDAWPPHAPTIIVLVYLIAVAGLVAARIRSYHAFRARCLGLPEAEESTYGMVRRVCCRLGVRRTPLIRLGGDNTSPFVFGLLRPVLVLPGHHLVRPDETETVIVHEATHLRRGDMLVRCLQCAAGLVLFFWPVVAWVNRRIDQAREHACDQWALSHGKLSASVYARCLLDAVETLPSRHLKYRPACMAGNPTTIERRIDVILTFPIRRTRRPIMGLFAVVALLAWGGVALTGAAGPDDDTKKAANCAATEAAMRMHAKAVYHRVNEYAAGDQNGDGEVSKEECWSFVTAVVMQQRKAVLKAYPQADRDEDGTLGLAEAYQFVRGDHELAKTSKKAQYAIEQAMKAGDTDRADEIKITSEAKLMNTYHLILDRRERLLDMMNGEPGFKKVKAIAAKMARIEAKAAVESGKAKPGGTFDQVLKLEQQAAELRAKAAELGTEKAKAYEAKANKLEQKAAKIRTKITAKIREEISRLKAAGKVNKAAKLKEKLAQIEDR